MKAIKRMNCQRVLTAVMIVGFLLITTHSVLRAQEQKLPGGPLASVDAALKRLDGPELNRDQKEQLRSLEREFHEEQKATRPGPGMREARQAYHDAILGLDSTSAQAQADIIVKEQAAMMRSNLENQANLKIGVLNVLSGDQKGLLLERIGTSGVWRLLGPQGPRERRGPGLEGRGPRVRRGPGLEGRGPRVRRGPGLEGRGPRGRRGPGLEGRGPRGRRGR